MKTQILIPFFIAWSGIGTTAYAQTENKAEIVEEGPYRYVEKMPEFPGGQEGLMQFMRDNLKYPVGSLTTGTQGAVYVSFTVDETGKVKDAKILKSIGEDFSAEVIRVVYLMPRWSPGLLEGKPIPVTYTLPVNFWPNKATKKEEKN